MLFGSASGSAYVVFGGERFLDYSEGYVVSWEAEIEALDQALESDDRTGGASSADIARIVLTFDGEDTNADDLLSSASDEISQMQAEIYLGEELVWFADDVQSDTFFEFTYEISSGRVLINADSNRTNLAREQYGLLVNNPLDPAIEEWALFSAFSSVVLLFDTEDGAVFVETVQSSELFQTLASPTLFDLNALTELPESGFRANAYTALPLQVAEAGDINGDGVGDFIVGHDQSLDEDEVEQPGRSFVVYGGPLLSSLDGTLDLEALTSDQGFLIEAAGGRVAAAGDVDGDGYDDLLVSAPHADGTNSDAVRAGESYVIFGAESGEGGPRFTITNAQANELAGSSLTSLGDIDGDGLSDVMIGAPNEPDVDDYLDAAENAQILYATRDVGLNTEWDVPQALDPLRSGNSPLSITETSLGTLALWTDAELDENGDPIYALYGSFFDGTEWSSQVFGSTATSARIHSTPNEITQATVSEITNRILVEQAPLVVWLERDNAESQTTKIFQSEW
ncbi:MAG: integrin alpha, partial [Pseudomonadota bacterium]